MGKSASLYFIPQHLYVPSPHFTHVLPLCIRSVLNVIIGRPKHLANSKARAYSETRNKYADGHDGHRIIRDAIHCVFYKEKELET